MRCPFEVKISSPEQPGVSGNDLLYMEGVSTGSRIFFSIASSVPHLQGAMLHTEDLAEAAGIAAVVAVGALGVGRTSTAATNRDGDG